MFTKLRCTVLFLSAAVSCGMQPEFVRADFVVTDVKARLDRNDLYVSTRIQLDLSEQAELAVENGVPLVVLTEFVLMRDGFLWDETLLES